MRILILVHGYPPTNTGGAELRAARTARSLAERGHCVSVLCVESTDATDEHPPYQDDIHEGLPVRRLSLKSPLAGRPLTWEHDNPETARALGVLITPSQYLADAYMRYGVEPAKIRTWRQGVNVDRCILGGPSSALRVG